MIPLRLRRKVKGTFRLGVRERDLPPGNDGRRLKCSRCGEVVLASPLVADERLPVICNVCLLR